MTSEQAGLAATADEFAEQLFTASLATADVLTVFIGDQLGYYQLLAGTGSMTSTELSAAAKADERYVREWLESQAISGYLLVENPGATALERRYELPAAQAEVLTDDESLSYLAPLARMIGASAVQLPAIVAAHRHGSGVSWEEFGDVMRDAQGEMNRPAFLGPLGSEWFPSIPDLHEKLANGCSVADIGCGHGWSAIGLAQAYPQITIDGYDVDEPSIQVATTNAAARGLGDRLTFSAADVGRLGGGVEYDVVLAFECIHDLPQPAEVLAAMRRIATDDGIVVVMDENVAAEFGAFDDDIERLMYGFSNLVCLPDGMSHTGSVGTGTVMRHSTLQRYAHEAGFAAVHEMPIDAGFWRFYRLV